MNDARIAELERQLDALREENTTLCNDLGQAQYERDAADQHSADLAWTLERLRKAARAVVDTTVSYTAALAYVDRAALDALAHCVSSNQAETGTAQKEETQA